MRPTFWSALLLLLVGTVPQIAAAESPAQGTERARVYYPGATWAAKSPSEVGVDAERLKEAVDFAIAGETKNTRDLVMNHYQTFGRGHSAMPSGPSGSAATRPASSSTVATSSRNGAIRAVWI